MLFSSYQFGPWRLPNRIVMPPMTRSRAAEGDVATALMAQYYAQRAGAGLIIAEGTQISPQAQGYVNTPGIYSPEQIEGWKKVTEAVHDKGGRIFAQLWHVGRVSHVSMQPGGQPPVAPSAVQAEGVKVFAEVDGVPQMVQHSMPRELTIPEIRQIVRDYAQAAESAMAAGFDGIELHGANGYLIEQFMDSGTNLRTDEYGGTLEKRLRFLKETVTAVSDAIGKERVGVRQAPLTTLGGAIDEHPELTYIAAAALMDKIGVGYIHIAEADWENAPVMPVAFKEAYREAYGGTLIYAGKYTPERAEEALARGWADLIGFGRPFIANPDLPYRLQHGLALNEQDRSTFFGGGAHGLTDYPAHAATALV
ncbi:alkene reductase [Chitinophaga lutea]